MSVSVVLQRVGELLEGPHWDEKSQCLYFIDIKTPVVHQWNRTTDEHKKVVLQNVKTVTSVVGRKQGGLAVTVDQEYATLDFESGELKSLAKVDRHNPETRMNDGKCDAMGRYWAGTMGPEKVPTKVEPELGTLYSLDKDCNVICHLSKIGISNGMAWSSDNRTMYYIDTVTKQVDAFDFDLEGGRISNRRSIFKVPENKGYADGMCIDEEGKLWIALYFGTSVVRVDPQTGDILKLLELPVSCPTSCCFGGPDYDELYITSTHQYFTEEQLKQEPLAGSVFKVTNLGVKGVPPHNFGG
ncbi:regucalcin-like [Ptychodera flava]|uniref:regucalcin-like n=1 Tax=Ptychodera flava TaxID=63121 RepID=UPI003969EF6A